MFKTARLFGRPARLIVGVCRRSLQEQMSGQYCNSVRGLRPYVLRRTRARDSGQLTYRYLSMSPNLSDGLGNSPAKFAVDTYSTREYPIRVFCSNTRSIRIAILQCGGTQMWDNVWR